MCPSRYWAGLVDVRALLQLATRRRAPDGSGDGAGAPLQNLAQVPPDPALGGRVPLLEEVPGSRPDVLSDMDEVQDQGDVHLGRFGSGTERADLRGAAVDEHDPPPGVPGVPLLGLRERFPDYVGRLRAIHGRGGA